MGQIMLERRQSTRRRTLLDGRIEIEKLNGWALDCTVRDVGNGGARVLIDGSAVIPTGFTLGISGREPRAARLVWYRDGQAGLQLPVA